MINSTNPLQLVFIDECHFTTRNQCRNVGWVSCNQSNMVNTQRLRDISYSLIAGIHINGLIYARIINTTNGGVKSEHMVSFILQLAQRMPPHGIIVLDNAKVHRSRDMREVLDQLNCGHIFLPPYSPDYNPIELFFNIVKNNLKRIEIFNLPLLEGIIRSIEMVDNRIYERIVLHTVNNHYLL